MFWPDKNTIEFIHVTITKDMNGTKDKVDILKDGMFHSLTINESIFQHIVSGTLIIDDKSKVFDSFPIVGGEKINFQFNDRTEPGKKKQSDDFEFEVTSFSVGVYDSNVVPTQKIILNFIDPTYKLLLKEYSTSFKDTLISGFVSDFSKKIFDKEIDNLEISDEKKSFSFPYQKWDYILKYLNQYAKSKVGDYYGYLYWSDLLKTNYMTLSGLLKLKDKDLQHTFKQVLPNMIDEDLNYFSEFNVKRDFDLMEIKVFKGDGNTNINFDPSNKSIVEVEKKYSEVIDKQVSTGKYTQFEDEIDDVNSFYYASSDNFRSEINIINQNLKNGNYYSIIADGWFGRRPGDLARLIFRDDLDFNKEENENTSGTYIITEIEHTFYPGSYEQQLTFLSTGSNIKISSKQKPLSNNVDKK